MLLYHVNVGFPVVDEGAEMLVPATGRQAARRLPGRWLPDDRCAGAGYIEQVFEHDLDRRSGRPVPVAIVNRAPGSAPTRSFHRDQLPRHFVWRMLGEGTYVVGIEPCTNRPRADSTRARAAS